MLLKLELGFLEKEFKRKRNEKRAKIVVRKDFACGFREGVIPTRNDIRIETSLGHVMGALRMGVTGGVMRRCVEDRTGDGGVEDGRDGKRHASVRGG
uniref:Uncharacterized protein n=1 Tax=Solanum tuberosum TaxID=4113 RepID=M1DXN7_SOLTU